MEPPIHLEAVVHRATDGLIAVVSSCLTGRVWEGFLWAVESAKDFDSVSNCRLTAGRTMAGNSDILWLNEKLLVVASDCGLLEVWEHTSLGHTLQQLFTLGSHDDMVMSLSHLGESQRIASGSADSRVIVWDVLTHSLIHTYKGHTDCVWCVSGKSTNSDIMASSSQDGTVRVWDLRESTPAAKFKESSEINRALCWRHDEDHILATAGETGQVCIFDLRSPNNAVLTYREHSRAIHRIKFCITNSSLVATVSNDSKVVVYNVNQDTLQYSSSGHSDFVHGLSWHPTKAELITCGWDGNMLSHDVTTTGDGDHSLTTSLEMSVEMK